MKNVIITILVVLVILLGGVLFMVLQGGGGTPIVGSIVTGQAYIATSTPLDMNQASGLIRGGWGSLGSVVVTGAGAAEYWLFNATTSPNSIDGFATSTNLLTVIPASLAAGTYVFDVQYTDGLYLWVQTSGIGTSTITYR